MNELLERHNHRHRLALGITIVWLAAVVMAFWWFSARFIVPFSETLVHFDGDILPPQMNSSSLNRVTIVTVIDPDCPCSGFAEGHWDELINRYPNVAFARATESNEWRGLHERVASSPAVAIWDSDGLLRYFGPFSGGAFCGSGDDYVAMALDAMASDENFKWINQDAVGCFCQRNG